MTSTSSPKVALVTGAARRIGAVIACSLHTAGMNIIIHYRHSIAEAQALANELNALRADSAQIIQADFNQANSIPTLAEQALTYWGRLDILVNNASSFYRTPIGEVSEAEWDDLFSSNLKAPFFLSQALAPYLAEQQGCIINIADIHAHRPLKDYTVYCTAKAGLVMLTKSLAKELAPPIRVNAVAPGAILWPEAGNKLDKSIQDKIIQQTALKRHGKPQDIAEAVLFLSQANYITGQVLAVDGGRTLSS